MVASTALEDEKDLSKVSCDMELYEIYVKGFLGSCGAELNAREIEMLPMGAKVMTYDVASVFLLTIWKEIIILKSTVKTIIWTAVVHSLSWWQIWSRNGSRCRQS